MKTNNWIEKRIADLNDWDAEYDRISQIKWRTYEIMYRELWTESQYDWYDTLHREMDVAMDSKDLNHLQKVLGEIFRYGGVIDTINVNIYCPECLEFNNESIPGTKFQWIDGKMKCIQRYSDDENDDTLYDCDIEVFITEENFNTIRWFVEVHLDSICNDLDEIDKIRGY